MKRAYIAGPMRGFANFNFPIFNQADRLLTAAGWEIFNPARMDLEAGAPWCDPTNPDYGNTDYPLTAQDMRNAARRDLDVIQSLREDDAVIMLPGWRKSTGSRAEFFVGKMIAVPRFSFRFAKTGSGFYMRGLK